MRKKTHVQDLLKLCEQMVRFHGNEGVCTARFPLNIENLEKEGKDKNASLRVGVGKLLARAPHVGDPPSKGRAIAHKR